MPEEKPKTSPGSKPVPEPEAKKPRTSPGSKPLPDPGAARPRTSAGAKPLPDPTPAPRPKTSPGARPLPDPAAKGGEAGRPRTRAAKSLQALDGDDEFSISSLKPGAAQPKVVLKPRIEEGPLPRGLGPPSRERNLFLRLFARIFR